jgi:RNA polymerase sigma factor (sigma-70 family)
MNTKKQGEKPMIRAELRFKNSAFIKGLKEKGFNSIKDFSDKSKIPYYQLIEYANLNLIPNEERQIIISKMLDISRWTLFEQYIEVVKKKDKKKNVLVKEIPVNDILSLDNKHVAELESEYSQNDIIDESSLKYDIKDSLNKLGVREKLVIEMYFGLNGYEETELEDIGKHIGLTRERTRQIKEKAIRRLRHKSRSKKLAPFVGLQHKLEDDPFDFTLESKTYREIAEDKREELADKWFQSLYEKEFNKLVKEWKKKWGEAHPNSWAKRALKQQAIAIVQEKEMGIFGR